MLVAMKAEIVELKEQVRQTNMLLLAQRNNDEEDQGELPEGVVLPASTTDELDALEETIEGDRSFQKYLVNTLVNSNPPKLVLALPHKSGISAGSCLAGRTCTHYSLLTLLNLRHMELGESRVCLMYQ